MKIRIGYSVSLLASDEVLASAAAVLMRCTDEKGARIAFEFLASEDPKIASERESHERAAREELERQGKSWLEQYQRAEGLEKRVKELESAQRVSA